MLTFDQWTTSHNRKLAGVSERERRKRYEQYRVATRSEPGTSRSGIARQRRNDSNPVRKGKRRENQLARFERRALGGRSYSDQMDRDAAAYLLSVVRPFDHIAGFPDPLSPKGQLDRLEFTKVFKADSYGNFCIVIRDGLTRHHAYTIDEHDAVPADGSRYGYHGVVPMWDDPAPPPLTPPDYYVVSAATGPMPGEEYGNRNEYLTYTAPTIIASVAPWDNFNLSPWQSNGVTNRVITSGAIKARQLSSKYRTTAQGVAYEYTNATVAASGRVVVAPIPASQLMGQFPIAFDTVDSLLGSSKWGPLDEWEAHTPVMDGSHEYRPVKASHFFTDAIEELPKTGYSIVDYSSCDVDAQAYEGAYHTASFTMLMNPDDETGMMMGVAGAAEQITMSPNAMPGSVAAGTATFGGYHAALNAWQDHTMGGDMQPLIIYGTGFQAGLEVAMITFCSNVEWLTESSQFGNPLSGGGIGHSMGRASARLPPQVISTIHEAARLIPAARKRPSEGNIVETGLDLAAKALPAIQGAINFGNTISKGIDMVPKLLEGFNSAAGSFAEASAPEMAEALLPLLAL